MILKFLTPAANLCAPYLGTGICPLLSQTEWPVKGYWCKAAEMGRFCFGGGSSGRVRCPRSDVGKLSCTIQGSVVEYLCNRNHICAVLLARVQSVFPHFLRPVSAPTITLQNVRCHYKFIFCLHLSEVISVAQNPTDLYSFMQL